MTRDKGDKDAMITFQFLRELQKLERESADLQQLDPDFYEILASYLRRKMELAAKDPNPELALRELANVRPVINYIIDRREQKIVAGAVKAARSPGFRLKSMLPAEEELFEKLAIILSDSRKKVEAVLTGLAANAGGANAQSAQTQPKKTSLKFLSDVPAFVSEDLQSYGPFSTGQSAEVPKSVGEILVKAGKAREIGG